MRLFLPPSTRFQRQRACDPKQEAAQWDHELVSHELPRDLRVDIEHLPGPHLQRCKRRRQVRPPSHNVTVAMPGWPRTKTFFACGAAPRRRRWQLAAFLPQRLSVEARGGPCCVPCERCGVRLWVGGFYFEDAMRKARSKGTARECIYIVHCN